MSKKHGFHGQKEILPCSISELAWTVLEAVFTLEAATDGNFGVAKMKGSSATASNGISISIITPIST